MNAITVTTSGLGFVAQAGTAGPYFPIRYFYPIYDERIDPDVHPEALTIPLSAATPVSATSPQGEIIYNVSALNAVSPGSHLYTITPLKVLPYDSNATTSGTGSDRAVIGSDFNATTWVNRLNSQPLSSYISGTSFTYQGSNWQVADYAVVSGANGNPYSPTTNRNKYFRVQSYAPITSAAGGNARGLFKIRLPGTVGIFKFNKVALYASKFLANGTEDTATEPVLFAVASLKQPILKTTDSSNINNFELDLELEFSSAGVASQVSFLGNDYWNRVAGGNALWFDGQVAVGSVSAVPGSWEPHARLNLTVGAGEVLPHIRLSEDNIEKHVDFRYLNKVLTIDTPENIIDVKFDTSGTGPSGEIHLLATGYGPSYRREVTVFANDIASRSGFVVEHDASNLLDLFKLQHTNSTFLELRRNTSGPYYSNIVLKDGGLAALLSVLEPTKYLTVFGGTTLRDGVRLNDLETNSLELSGTDSLALATFSFQGPWLYLQAPTFIASAANDIQLLAQGGATPLISGAIDDGGQIHASSIVPSLAGFQLGRKYNSWSGGSQQRLWDKIYGFEINAKRRIVVRTNVDESSVTSLECTISAGTSGINYGALELWPNTFTANIGDLRVYNKTAPLGSFGRLEQVTSIFNVVGTSQINISASSDGGIVSLMTKDGTGFVVSNSTFVPDASVSLIDIGTVATPWRNGLFTGFLRAPMLSGMNAHVLGTVSADNGYFESSRPEKLGYWTQYVPSVTGNGGSLASNDVYFARYTLMGKTLIVNFQLGVAASTSGTVTDVNMTLPVGISADSVSASFIQPGQCSVGIYYREATSGNAESTQLRVAPGENVLRIQRANGTDPFSYFDTAFTYLRGSMAIQIQ